MHDAQPSHVSFGTLYRSIYLFAFFFLFYEGFSNCKTLWFNSGTRLNVTLPRCAFNVPSIVSCMWSRSLLPVNWKALLPIFVFITTAVPSAAQGLLALHRSVFVCIAAQLACVQLHNNKSDPMFPRLYSQRV